MENQVGVVEGMEVRIVDATDGGDGGIADRVKEDLEGMMEGKRRVREQLEKDKFIQERIDGIVGRWRREHLEEQVRKRRRLEGERRRKPFICGQGCCPYSFQNQEGLALHIRLVHEEVTPQKCGYCWKAFPTEGRLEEHVRREHNGRCGGKEEDKQQDLMENEDKQQDLIEKEDKQEDLMESEDKNDDKPGPEVLPSPDKFNLPKRCQGGPRLVWIF